MCSKFQNYGCENGMFFFKNNVRIEYNFHYEYGNQNMYFERAYSVSKY